jgi:hypothetical protein
MAHNEPNLFVIENRLNTFEKSLHELAAIVNGQVNTTNNLLRAVELMQHTQADITPKVGTLWENRSQLKGGYVVLSVACSLIVGIATIIGVIFSAHK